MLFEIIHIKIETHYYSISCPQNNNFKKSFNINDFIEKTSPQSTFVSKLTNNLIFILNYYYYVNDYFFYIIYLYRKI